MDKSYMWVNLSDLSEIGPVMGGTLTRWLNNEKGEHLWSGSFVKNGDSRIDEVYIILEASADTLQKIKDAADVISKYKIGRKMRTKITSSPPGGDWHKV